MTVKTREYEMVTLQGDMMTPISIYQAVRGRKKMLLNRLLSTKKVVDIHLSP